jgi:putative SOS response-associated peptidase YedK
LPSAFRPRGDTKFSAKLERGADRLPARRPLRRQGHAAQPRHAALGPDPLYWAKDIKVGFANINAKAEGIENKPAFGEAFRQRRCLVRSTIFMSGRKPLRASSPTRSR